MNLNHLYYFQCLAQLQHYAKAANELHVSQSNLSYAISMLEEELEAQLFEKQGRNVALTRHGVMFLEYVNRALNELAIGKEVIKNKSKAERQTVRISTFRIHTIDYFIQDFLKNEKNPMTHFEVNHNKTVDIIEDLKNRKIDVGFCSYSTVDSALEFIPVLRQEVVVLLPHEHPLSSRSELDLADIAHLPIIISHGSDGMYKKIIELYTKTGITPVFGCKADSSNAAAHFVSNNFGIALAVFNPMLKYFNIKITPLRNPPHDFYLYLTYAKKQWHPPAVHSFIKHALMLNPEISGGSHAESNTLSEKNNI